MHKLKNANMKPYITHDKNSAWNCQTCLNDAKKNIILVHINITEIKDFLNKKNPFNLRFWLQKKTLNKDSKFKVFSP